MIKIDIWYVFNRIHMHLKKNENLIIFKTKYDTYKYLIMLLKLINDSFIFQNFMNNILMNYLNNFITTYLNDIIMYNNTKKKQIKHVRKILQRLRKTNIQVEIDKCEFHITKTKFLNMIMRRNKIKMNFEKIKTIIE